MKIAVIGAYGNGKTTLTKSLAHTLGVPRVHGEPMRGPTDAQAKSLGDCDESEVFELTMRRLVERVTAEEQAGGSFVSDGSVLHEWVYLSVRTAVGCHPFSTAHAEPRASVFAELVRRLGFVARQRFAASYDLAIHVPADAPLTRGETAINDNFRVLSDRLLVESVHELGVPLHIVRGDVEQRLARVVDLIAAPAVDRIYEDVIS